MFARPILSYVYNLFRRLLIRIVNSAVLRGTHWEHIFRSIAWCGLFNPIMSAVLLYTTRKQFLEIHINYVFFFLLFYEAIN